MRSEGGAHVLHVLGGFSFGGTERLCLDIVRHAPFGVRSTVMGLDPGRRGLEKEFQATGRTAVFQGGGLSKGRLQLLSDMVRTLRELQPDAVIVYVFGVTHLLIGLAARLAGSPPVVVSAGNPPPTGAGRWKWSIVVAASRVLNVPIQACSEGVLAQLQALGVGMPARSGVIPNGCAVWEIVERAAEARQQRAAKRPMVIGMVARLDAIKDHATLIEAFALLTVRGQCADCELWLVGDGEKRGELEALAARSNVGPRVRFLGPRADIPELLGQMDVYAFSTTRDEGFGIAVVEAMAAGLPVVASDVSACREILADGRHGQLVAPGMADALATALGELVASPEARKRGGNLAFRRAKETYDMSDVARRWYRAVALEHAGDAREGRAAEHHSTRE